MTSVSQLLLGALKLDPVGARAEEPGVCAFCGASYSADDLVSPPSLSSGFMDGRCIQAHGKKPLVCGCCATLSSADVLRKVQDVIITETAVYPIGKGLNRVWFLLNPPTPPFAVLFSTSQSQHMWWKVPISRSSDHWYVQLGPRTIMVNRLRALQALDAIGRVMGAFSQGKKSPVTSPFVGLDPWQSETTTGLIRSDVRRFCVAEGYGVELKLFESLGRGELWALNPLLYKRDEATRPDPMTISIHD